MLETKSCWISTDDEPHALRSLLLCFECANCASAQYETIELGKDGIASFTLRKFLNHRNLLPSKHVLVRTDAERVSISCGFCGREHLACLVFKSDDGTSCIELSYPEVTKDLDPPCLAPLVQSAQNGV